MAEEKAGHVKHEEEAEDKPNRRRRLPRRSIFIIPILLLIVVLVPGVYVYSASPANIRNPWMEHLHFRMQVIMNGKPVDFSSVAFQTPYEKGQCSADLSKEPIHFHDGKSQFVHIHWKDITGGQVLKNYGWNLIGGPDNVLGYRMDNLPKVGKVPIHGKALPQLPKDAKMWIYMGDEKGYQERPLEAFTHEKLERFFGKKSNFMTYAPSSGGVLAWLFPKASAHAGHDHSAETTPATVVETDEERRTRIQNLVGNVVIFVQPEKPTAEQITGRFAALEPLSDSTCGG